MLSELEFNSWCSNRNLSIEVKKEISQIRVSQPVRKVGGGYKNVCGQYPSRKMGVSIQFESHKNELPAIYKFEYDDSILEYYDQPSQLKLFLKTSKGSRKAYLRTPDFFVIGASSAGWIECKTEKELEKLQEKNSNHYYLGDDNRWHYPPGEAYAEERGLTFHVFSDAEINWVFYRNLVFLNDYYCLKSNEEEGSKDLLISFISKNPGISLKEVLNHPCGFSKDFIYSSIALKDIYIDLEAASLIEPERCCLFSNKEISIAYKISIDTMSQLRPTKASGIKFELGEKLIYEDQELTILFLGNENLLLQDRSQKICEYKISEIEQLIVQGKIKPLTLISKESNKDEVSNHLAVASQEDLAIANMRFEYITGKVEGGYSLETIRKWRRSYNTAEKQYGSGYIGLIPRIHQRGNRQRKISEVKIQLMTEIIEQEHENFKQSTIMSVYGTLVRTCEERGMPIHDIPSYKTFVKEVKKRPVYDQELKRKGHKAAYQHQEFQYELNFSVPTHGDRPLEIGHIDHTELDIELRCSNTGKELGRPWLTMLMDANTRRILAIYLTFDPPSYRSCMMVIRTCIQRHGRLPQTVVTDNGAEFHSIYYESLLIYLGCTFKYRPPSKSRFGSVCERLFNTSSKQFIYNLTGNTQITKDVRITTKYNNPKELAIWQLGRLYEYLFRWAYDFYDQTNHLSLGISPKEAWLNGIAKFGSREHKFMEFNHDLKMLTLPSTRKGTARIRVNKGVRINNIHYWANDFRDPELEGADVDVRYDPFDMGVVYVFVKGRWIECQSRYYNIFKGRSEKEVKIASAEFKKRHERSGKQLKLNAFKLGSFLQEIQSEEVVLTQRLKDLESRKIFDSAEESLLNHSNESEKILHSGKDSDALTENTTSTSASDDDFITIENNDEDEITSICAEYEFQELL